MGHPIIMGRKTFESIGKPLPGRENIVLTRNKDYKSEGITVYNYPLPLVKAIFRADKEVFIIGGEAIYKYFLPLADKLILTIVSGKYDGDAFFPEFDSKDYNETNVEHVIEGTPHVFITYERKT